MKKDKEIIKYCSRAIVRYLNDDYSEFLNNANKAKELKEKKEKLYFTINEELDDTTIKKLQKLGHR